MKGGRHTHLTGRDADFFQVCGPSGAEA